MIDWDEKMLLQPCHLGTLIEAVIFKEEDPTFVKFYFCIASESSFWRADASTKQRATWVGKVNCLLSGSKNLDEQFKRDQVNEKNLCYAQSLYFTRLNLTKFFCEVT